MGENEDELQYDKTKQNDLSVMICQRLCRINKRRELINAWKTDVTWTFEDVPSVEFTHVVFILMESGLCCCVPVTSFER